MYNDTFANEIFGGCTVYYIFIYFFFILVYVIYSFYKAFINYYLIHFLKLCEQTANFKGFAYLPTARTLMFAMLCPYGQQAITRQKPSVDVQW